MRQIFVLVSAMCLSFTSLFTNESDQAYREDILRCKNHYQDIVLGGEILEIGETECKDRYELIKPVLDRFNGSFSVLDIGACEGYFSFRIASEYPALCHMIEGGYYPDKPNKLLSLTRFNNFSNIYLMHTKLNLDILKEISEEEHFDLVFAFLVIHQMADQRNEHYVSHLDESKKYIELFLSLGSYLIIETSTDLYPHLDQYVMDLCNELGGEYL